MEQSCHRCGASLSREDTFCPSCGAPQLNFDLSNQEPTDAATDPHASPGRPGQVNWRDAIGAAVMVAIPAGILCELPFFSLGWLLWVMGGASLVVMLYKKKRPLSVLSGRAGFRIGSLTGLATAYVSVAAAAVVHVVQRFPLHLGDTIDHEYETAVEAVTVFQSSPDVQAQVRSYLHFMLTPDGRAAASFGAIVSITAYTIFFAAIGGYLGVRLFAGRRLA